MPNLLCSCFRRSSKSAERPSVDRASTNVATRSSGASFSRPLPAHTPNPSRYGLSVDSSASSGSFDIAAFMREKKEAKAQIEAHEAEQAERERHAATRAAALAARKDPATVAAARRLITGNMQLSANRPAVLREFERLMRADEDGTPEDLAYEAMNNVMDTINGSDNAIREEHGGYLRR